MGAVFNLHLSPGGKVFFVSSRSGIPKLNRPCRRESLPGSGSSRCDLLQRFHLWMGFCPSTVLWSGLLIALAPWKLPCRSSAPWNSHGSDACLRSIGLAIFLSRQGTQISFRGVRRPWMWTAASSWNEIFGDEFPNVSDCACSNITLELIAISCYDSKSWRVGMNHQTAFKS